MTKFEKVKYIEEVIFNILGLTLEDLRTGKRYKHLVTGKMFFLLYPLP